MTVFDKYRFPPSPVRLKTITGHMVYFTIFNDDILRRLYDNPMGIEPPAILKPKNMMDMAIFYQAVITVNINGMPCKIFHFAILNGEIIRCTIPDTIDSPPANKITIKHQI